MSRLNADPLYGSALRTLPFSPCKGSQTDDGYAVYTEAELGINGKGGGECAMLPVFQC